MRRGLVCRTSRELTDSLDAPGHGSWGATAKSTLLSPLGVTLPDHIVMNVMA